jgi:phosphotransferase system  glucose/maltose/N-acetylglucosamine-specific IIC component
MSERTVADIRQEIATERQRLDDNLTALEGELLSGVPFVAGGLVAAALLIFATARRRKRKKPKPTAITLSWKLR